jgi:catechol 2,3-dioxygenase-like lactoylglutathione lyase family enzyme
MGSDPTLNLVVLRCNDLARSRRFYDALGLRFVDERHGQRPPHLAATLPGGTVVELYPADPTTPLPAQIARDPRLGFAVEHVDAVVAQIEGLGAPVVVRPADSDDHVRRAIVVDPDGRRVELLAREP